MMDEDLRGRILRWHGFCKVWHLHVGGHRVEVVQSNDSLNLLIYVRDRGQVLLLEQPRTGKIFLEGLPGTTTSTIAGRFDVAASPVELAIKEAQEEAGIALRSEQVEFLNNGRPMYLSPGLNTERVILAYAGVTSDQIEQGERTFSAPDEDEQIKRVWMSLDEFRNITCEDVRLFLYREWFFRTKHLISLRGRAG